MLARQMGYFDLLAEKNETAPSEQSPGILGMIVPSLSDLFVTGITPLIQKAFTGIGVGFSVITRDPDDQRFDRMIVSFRKFFSGLILVGEAADDHTVRTLRSADYPFIVLEKNIKNLRLNTVCTDTAAGSRLIVDHIRKLGYKNVVIVTVHSQANSHRQEVDDITSALSQYENSLSVRVVELESGNAINGSDFDQLEKLLRPPFRAEIIISVQAKMVYQLMRMLQNKKLRVPQDVAIVSMEEGPGFDLIISPITCLRKPLEAIANKVANMVWSEVKNGGKGKFKRQVNLPPELIVRKSCGTLK